MSDKPKFPRADAIAAAKEILKDFRAERVIIAGSLRRRKMMVGDVEIVYIPKLPYPQSTRDAGGKGYVHELSEQDHRQLLWMANRSIAKIAISGYHCDLYHYELKDWRRCEKNVQANGQRGSVPRTEVLWMNY